MIHDEGSLYLVPVSLLERQADQVDLVRRVAVPLLRLEALDCALARSDLGDAQANVDL